MKHRGTARTRGTDSGYTMSCRCDDCRLAHNAYHREHKRRLRAQRYAAGLNGNGKPRVLAYDERALALMKEFALRPDPRFMPGWAR